MPRGCSARVRHCGSSRCSLRATSRTSRCTAMPSVHARPSTACSLWCDSRGAKWMKVHNVAFRRHCEVVRARRDAHSCPRVAREAPGIASLRGSWGGGARFGPGLAKDSGTAFRRFQGQRMKPIKSFLVLAILLAPALASAQGYYGRPYAGSTVPGGFHNRAGRLIFGFGGGLGGMSDSQGDVTCDTCNFNTLSFEGDVHLGGMVNPRLGLMFEGQVNSQQIDSQGLNGDAFLTQGAAMFAAQFWVLPILWIKGGVGFASLQKDDQIFTTDEGTGGAVMGA